MKQILFLFACFFLSDLCAQQSDTTKQYNLSTPESRAEYPGGLNECMKFIHTHIHYPDTVDGIEGKVYVSFIIDSTGAISDIRIKKSLGKKFDDEAIRIIKLMPNWIPGTMNGKPVKSRMTMPIVFRKLE